MTGEDAKMRLASEVTATERTTIIRREFSWSFSCLISVGLWRVGWDADSSFFTSRRSFSNCLRSSSSSARIDWSTVAEARASRTAGFSASFSAASSSSSAKWSSRSDGLSKPWDRSDVFIAVS
ncbi:hypothetical protein D3C71_1850570 [compost metagenome]